MMMYRALLAMMVVQVVVVRGDKPKPEPDACWKEAVGRGTGTVPDHGACPPSEEKSAGLCYPTCAAGLQGIGPICWGTCADPYPANGMIFCCETEEICKTHLKDLGVELPKAVAKAIADAAAGVPIQQVLDDLRNLVRDALDLDFPLCGEIHMEKPLHPEVVKKSSTNNIKANAVEA